MKKLVAVCALVFVCLRGDRVPAAALSSSSFLVDVATVAELQAAVANLTSGVTVRIAPGRYALTQELRIENGVRNVALVGATGNRADVVIVGSGMATPGVNIAIKVENAQDVRIADLSVGEAFWHPIQLKGESGAERVHISNVRVFDSGEQFIKATVDFANPNGVDDVIVEGSLIEFTVIGPAHGYTEGIDIHHGANWIIRNNVIRNIRVPAGATYVNRPGVLAWSGSRNTQVYNNTFINCERAVIFGQGGQEQFGNSHSGGAIYNNFIYRTEALHADAGISIWDSPGTRVYHNTVIQNGTYPTAIEYRFASTVDVEIMNNLTDGAILQREGAAAVVSHNYTQANAGFFVNPGAADLHLTSAAVPAIDTGTTVSSVVTDWDGQARPAGAAPDLGADELVAGGGPPPPPDPEPDPIVLIAPVIKATISGRTVQLSWTDFSTGETEYVVERSSERRDGFQVIARLPADANGYAETGAARTQYRYRVRAFSATNGQSSPYSNVVTAKTR
jgi:hypothetical protein